MGKGLAYQNRRALDPVSIIAVLVKWPARYSGLAGGVVRRADAATPSRTGLPPSCQVAGPPDRRELSDENRVWRTYLY